MAQDSPAEPNAASRLWAQEEMERRLNQVRAKQPPRQPRPATFSSGEESGFFSTDEDVGPVHSAQRSAQNVTRNVPSDQVKNGNSDNPDLHWSP